MQSKEKKRLKDLPAPKVPKVKKTVKEIGKYTFTSEEKYSMSVDIGKKQIDKRVITDEKKSVMSGYKDRLDRIELDINKLSRHIVDGHELREFECTVEKDFDAKLKRFRDVHTGKIINERPLDPSDFQRELAI